eukprot:TRINITY_DN17626_c0_g1_i1.p3 TRINITY_DN17626_c0_g1~~TRINITY_DN17626_c0_g1_i1.p3  ORF type:complete len:216 (+),score=41.51 TRINITY_DN17626_c0_g1_i1:1202-1849(+)
MCQEDWQQGNPNCPCVSVDAATAAMGDETMVSVGEKSVFYPSGLGSTCSAWDDGRYPDACVTEGQSPGPGTGWCAQKWCYVDPCNCDLEPAPRLTSYLPEANYNGMAVHYSYATCGSPNSFDTETESQRCLHKRNETACLGSGGEGLCAWYLPLEPATAKGRCLEKELGKQCAEENAGFVKVASGTTTVMPPSTTEDLSRELAAAVDEMADDDQH